MTVTKELLLEDQIKKLALIAKSSQVLTLYFFFFFLHLTSAVFIIYTDHSKSSFLNRQKGIFMNNDNKKENQFYMFNANSDDFFNSNTTQLF
jgi:hypothetical protein